MLALAIILMTFAIVSWDKSGNNNDALDVLKKQIDSDCVKVNDRFMIGGLLDDFNTVVDANNGNLVRLPATYSNASVPDPVFVSEVGQLWVADPTNGVIYVYDAMSNKKNRYYYIITTAQL